MRQFEQCPQNADIEGLGLAKTLHHRLVHWKAHVVRIHLCGWLHKLAVKEEDAVWSDEFQVLGRSLVGQGNQNVGVLDLGVVDGLVGDDHVGARRTAPGLRAVALGLDGVVPLVETGRLGQQDGHGDDALTAGTGKKNAIDHELLLTLAISLSYSSQYSGSCFSTKMPRSIRPGFSFSFAEPMGAVLSLYHLSISTAPPYLFLRPK